ncbi:MAG: acyl-CoA thioester hydrolase [Sulfurimonas sp.]|nr:MAG: acyl-CoA thioester hydrolase [Sulfurimonas sp.]
MKIRVYYEDTDTGGVVYHSNYLNFCERARSEEFFKKGISPILKEGHFIARKLEVDYFASAKLGDELLVKTNLLQINGASFKLLQEIYKGSKKLFEMKITLVHISFEGKAQKISKKTKELILVLFDT